MLIFTKNRATPYKLFRYRYYPELDKIDRAYKYIIPYYRTKPSSKGGAQTRGY